MNKLTTNEWYRSLVQELDDIIKETAFGIKWALVEQYHQIGERLIKDEDKMPITQLVQKVAVSLKSCERNLWKAVKFYKMFPDLAKLPEGKNMSWTKIDLKYLTEKTECDHTENYTEIITISRKKCKLCGKVLNEEKNKEEI